MMSDFIVSPLALMAFLNTLMWTLGLLSLIKVGYCNFLYGSSIVGFDTSCTTSGWYHGGMNMRGLGVGHPKGPMGGLKGGFLSRSPLGEFPPSESLGCSPSSGWWSQPLGMWVGKLVVTCIVVGTNIITSCWIGCLSLLVNGWTTVGNWFPTRNGIYVGGTIGYLGTQYIIPGTKHV